MEQLNQQFIEAGTLMLAGMVFVFTFLGLLILFINTVLIRLANKYPDAIVQPSPQRSTKKSQTASDEISPSIVAAISAGITRYRQQHKLTK
ncbi:OadG family protein [Colwelliaceae bacterium 6471]